ncbi:MAG: MMPL family transporter [Nocardia sp.]|nr:MMPL family transporter [Nocardia sp.]
MTTHPTQAQPVADPAPPPPPSSRLSRWGLRMARHRRIVLAFWVLILLGGALAQPQLDQRLLAPDLSVDHSESATAAELVSERFPTLGDEQHVIVFDSATVDVDSGAYRTVITDALAAAASTSGVRVLIGPWDRPDRQISADRHAAYAVIGLDGDMPARSEVAGRLAHALDAHSTAQVTVAATGNSAIMNDVIEVEKADTVVAEMIGMPIAFALLAIALGGLVAAFVPIGVALAAILLCVGVLFGLSTMMPVNPLMLSMSTMIGTGVGIDYALIVVSRFREALRRNLADDVDPADAVDAAVAESSGAAGRTVLASGVIVMVSMCALAIVPVQLFRGVALSVSAAVLGTLLVSVTLLPAVLAVLGRRIERGALPSWLGTAVHADPTANRSARWARTVMRRPLAFGLTAVAVLAALAWPISAISYGNDIGVSQIPDSSAGRAASVLSREFGPGMLAPIQLVVAGAPGSPSVATTTDRLIAEFTGDPRIVGFDRIPGDGAVLLSVVPAVPVDSPESAALVRDLRAHARVIGAESDAAIALGGTTAAFVELAEVVTDRMAWVVAAVLTCSLLLLVIMLRSIVLPIKAIAMNLLATAAALGITVMVFQWGWGEQVLDFTSRGFLQAFLPITVFVVLFGLSMDYEVFLIHRIREFWDRAATGDAQANIDSVADGIGHTARYITTAAAIMVVVFGSFVTAQVTEIKQIGFTLAVAILLDAFVIRMILVPAFMRLMGRWNWWLPRRTGPGPVGAQRAADADR